MMEGAYFIPRKEIIDFFNSRLSMSLSKIEETASGAVACQLMDYMFPGSVPMKRVNWEAKSEFQYIENYKLLQVAFTKHRVQKEVNVDRLIRAKYQDNLEFCQWLKAFFEYAASSAPGSREDYDPLSRRQLGKGGKRLNAIFLPRGMKKNGIRSISSSAHTPSSRSVNSNASRPRPLSSRPSSASSIKTQSNAAASLSSSSRTNTVRSSIMPKRGMNIDISPDAELVNKNEKLKRKNAELELTLDNIENERDFYFDKLRGIEVMLQVHDEKGEESNAEELIQRIFKVLYAKADDDIVVTEEGELIDNEVNLDEEDESVITMEDLAD